MAYNLFLVIVSTLLLWVGADRVVESASAIARRFNLSELVIGLTVVALGTSLPEFLVTSTAAFKGLGDISLSNIVGSNIFNLGLILGVMAVIRPVPTSRPLVYRDTLLLFAVTILVLVMALDLRMGRLAGIVLLSILVCYNLLIVLRFGKIAPLAEVPVQRTARWYDWPFLLLGFAAVAAGGHWMVEGASSLARMAGVSEWAIGVTIVAAGTSLPELITCLSAALKGRNQMLLGNLVGSDLFNFAGVLGLTCILRPLQISPSALPSLYALVGMVFLVFVFLRTGWRIGRAEGMVLVGLNLLRWGVDFAAS
ncbi:MAG: calcium/sodium antiporter [Desulfonatronovibrionaceae bacterium]